MAIIKCAKCGSEISDKSTNCMICGFKVSETLKKIAHEEMIKRNAPKKEEEHVSSVTLSEPKKNDNKKEDTIEIVQIGEKNLKEVHDPSYRESDRS